MTIRVAFCAEWCYKSTIMRQLPAQPNQSLIDGLACLQEIAVAGEPVGSRELARRLGMEPTRVNRLIKTLAHLGLAAQTASRKYAAGPAIHVLATQTIYASGLLPRAIRIIRHLQRTGCYVALGVLWRDQVSYLFHAEPARPVEEGIGRAGLYPATRSAIGMVLLSAQAESVVRELYRGRDIPRYGREIAALLADLRRIRELGYVRLLLPESSTMAVPVGDAPSMAVALSGNRVSTSEQECLGELKEAARGLAQQSKRRT